MFFSFAYVANMIKHTFSRPVCTK